MSRRYMDFVPSKNPRGNVTRVAKPKDVPVVSRQVSAVKTVRRENVGHVSGAVSRNVVQKKVVYREIPASSTPRRHTPVPREQEVRRERIIRAESGASGISLKNEPQFGVIEDLSPKFVKTEVEKRPLSNAGTGINNRDDLRIAKAKKIGFSRSGKKVENSVENSVENDGKKKEVSTYKTPRTPFINHEKVSKRPLSRNVYQKKVVATEEKLSGPVTIIAKPEKDSHAGIVVIIIITIVLGALAGTVAFLLLPK